MGRKGTMRAGDKVWAASSTLRKLKGKLLADAGQSVEGESGDGDGSRGLDGGLD